MASIDSIVLIESLLHLVVELPKLELERLTLLGVGRLQGLDGLQAGLDTQWGNDGQELLGETVVSPSAGEGDTVRSAGAVVTIAEVSRGRPTAAPVADVELSSTVATAQQPCQ